LKATSVSEKSALDQFTATLEVEKEMKRAQFLMLVRAKNLLTPAQQEKLRAIVESQPPKGKKPPTESGTTDVRQELNARMQKVQAEVDRWRREGRDPGPILELMKTFGDQMQAGQFPDAKETLQRALERLAARSISKSDPSVTQEQRDKARATVDAANTKLREKVASILTPEQKALIAKVNEAYQATVDEIGVVYEEKYASIKADPAARQRVQQEKNQDTEDHFLHKLDTLLTPAQRDAMTKAAEEEQRRADASPKKTAK
jgi:hypothetical protein